MRKGERDRITKHFAPRVAARRVAHYLQNAVRKRRSSQSPDETASMLDNERKYDPASNAETTPPDDECVDLPCMWAVEFYTPSHVNQLVDNLKDLGWDKSNFPGRESPAAWVRIARQHSQGRQWLNLGTIRSRDDKRPWPPRDRTAPLPKNVRYARGGLYSFAPSLTCIVVCFVFEDTFRYRVDAALRRYRQTFTRPESSWIHTFDPEMQKSEEVRLLRQDNTRLAAAWFRENLPGVFSSDSLEGRMPTCELMTLRRAEPFPDREKAEHISSGYMRVLDLEFSLSAWRSKDFPSLKISLYFWGQELDYHSVFTAKVDELDDVQLLESYGGLPGLPTYVDLTYQQMIGKLAIRALLDSYSKRVNELRDAVTVKIRRPSRRKPSHALQVLIDNVAYDVDIATVVSDVIATTEESSRFYRDLASFEPCGGPASEGSLAEVFRTSVKRHATSLNLAAQSLRDHLTQFGTLVAAAQGVRTQNQILCLTVIVAFLTVVVAVFAAITFFTGDADSALKDWLQEKLTHLRW